MHKITAYQASMGGTVAVAGLVFSLSFTKLQALAVQNGVAGWQAWMVPLAVDGLVVVATAASAKMSSHRWYAWTLLLLGTLISVAGNVAYSLTNDPGNPIAVGISALPPLMLLAVTHLTIVLSRQKRSEDATESTETGRTPELVAV